MDIITNTFQALLGSGLIHWNSDTVYACLYNSSATFTKDSSVYTDANELPTGSGYTRKDLAISGKAVTWDDPNDEIMYDCSDISWTATTGDIGPARYCAVVHSGESKYLYIMDFGSDKTANSGTQFLITIDASGLLRSKQA